MWCTVSTDYTRVNVCVHSAVSTNYAWCLHVYTVSTDFTYARVYVEYKYTRIHVYAYLCVYVHICHSDTNSHTNPHTHSRSHSAAPLIRTPTHSHLRSHPHSKTHSQVLSALFPRIPSDLIARYIRTEIAEEEIALLKSDFDAVATSDGVVTSHDLTASLVVSHGQAKPLGGLPFDLRTFNMIDAPKLGRVIFPDVLKAFYPSISPFDLQSYAHTYLTNTFQAAPAFGTASITAIANHPSSPRLPTIPKATPRSGRSAAQFNRSFPCSTQFVSNEQVRAPSPGASPGGHAVGPGWGRCLQTSEAVGGGVGGHECGWPLVGGVDICRLGCSKWFSLGLGRGCSLLSPSRTTHCPSLPCSVPPSFSLAFSLSLRSSLSVQQQVFYAGCSATFLGPVQQASVLQSGVVAVSQRSSIWIGTGRVQVATPWVGGTPYVSRQHIAGVVSDTSCGIHKIAPSGRRSAQCLTCHAPSPAPTPTPRAATRRACF